MIKQESTSKIANGFAQFGFPSLDVVLDMMYGKAHGNTLPYPEFIKFVTQSANVQVPENDLKLFMNAISNLNKESIDKSDLFDLLEVPYKQAAARKAMS